MARVQGSPSSAAARKDGVQFQVAPTEGSQQEASKEYLDLFSQVGFREDQHVLRTDVPRLKGANEVRELGLVRGVA